MVLYIIILLIIPVIFYLLPWNRIREHLGVKEVKFLMTFLGLCIAGFLLILASGSINFFSKTGEEKMIKKTLSIVALSEIKSDNNRPVYYYSRLLPDGSEVIGKIFIPTRGLYFEYPIIKKTDNKFSYIVFPVKKTKYRKYEPWVYAYLFPRFIFWSELKDDRLVIYKSVSLKKLYLE